MTAERKRTSVASFGRACQWSVAGFLWYFVLDSERRRVLPRRQRLRPTPDYDGYLFRRRRPVEYGMLAVFWEGLRWRLRPQSGAAGRGVPPRQHCHLRSTQCRWSLALEEKAGGLWLPFYCGEGPAPWNSQPPSTRLADTGNDSRATKDGSGFFRTTRGVVVRDTHSGVLDPSASTGNPLLSLPERAPTGRTQGRCLLGSDKAG